MFGKPIEVKNTVTFDPKYTPFNLKTNFYSFLPLSFQQSIKLSKRERKKALYRVEILKRKSGVCILLLFFLLIFLAATRIIELMLLKAKMSLFNIKDSLIKPRAK